MTAAATLRAALLGYVWCRFNSTSVAVAWRSSTELHHLASPSGWRCERRADSERAAVHRDNVRFEFEVVAAYDPANTGPVRAARVWRSLALALRCRTLAVCTANSVMDPVSATHASRERVIASLLRLRLA